MPEMEKKIVDTTDLKVGKYVLIDDEPCRIVDIQKSKPGKHGEAKVRVEAIGVFDDRKRSILKPAGHKVEVPIINKKTGQVLTIVGNQVQLMDMESYETFELPFPQEEEIKNLLKEGKEVLYMEIGNKRKILQAKGE